MNWFTGLVNIILLVLFTIGFTVSQCRAAELEQAMRDAVRYSKYELPNRMPRVFELSNDEIQARASGHVNCSPAGIYRWGSHTIVLSSVLNDLSKPYAHSWRMHEFIHYLQDINGRKNETAIDRRLLEAEAYGVQNKYLRERNLTPLTPQIAHKCEND